MGKSINLIGKKIDELINLLLTKGVQPSDIASNIFLEDYNSICYKKVNGIIVGELTFQDTEVSSSILRYFYSPTQEVIKIEEDYMGIKSTIWDRSYEESKVVNELVNLLKNVYDEGQISKFIVTLPEKLQNKILVEVNSLTA